MLGLRMSAPDSTDDQFWLTKTEAAQRLRVSGKTIQRLAKSGKLPAYRQGRGLLRFRREDVDAVLVQVR